MIYFLYYIILIRSDSEHDNILRAHFLSFKIADIYYSEARDIYVHTCIMCES